MSTPTPANIASALPALAARQPQAVALQVPVGGAGAHVRYQAVTYAELDARSDAIARGLTAIGIGPGVRAALMVKPSAEFFALVFGLFKAGAVPVMVDPGIGLKHLKTCLGEARPTAFIGIPAAHLARQVLGWARETVKILVTVGPRLTWGGHTLKAVAQRGAAGGPFLAATTGHDLAAILFTSGSTGVPKGVEYQHRHFLAQVDLIRDTYGITPGEVDLPTFPLFALFDPALGMTTVIPKMDFTRPAKIDPVHLLEIAERFSATNMFGSPAVLDTLGRHLARTGGPRLRHLRRVISAGAPVTGPVMARCLAGLPEGARIHTPYGATENLPVTTIDSAEILGETWARSEAGDGVCVGRPVPPNDVRIIRITDDPLPHWTDDLALPTGARGEITVQGPTTTEAYFGRPESTAAAKIRMPDGQIRHRMGDVGWLDAQGRLWFCGRVGHRVYPASGPLDPVPCEQPFNTHPAVRRCALVGVGPVGSQRPVICIEREPEGPQPALEALAAELRALALAHPHTQEIETFLDHGPLPVDIRHNAKINRPLLARWAAAQLKVAP